MLVCFRSDWLLWLVARIGFDRGLITLVACDCIEFVLHLIIENEEYPRKAIETVRAFIVGKATIKEVNTAANASFAATVAADYVDTAFDINAAIDDVVIYATDTVYYHAYAADAATYAASAAGTDDFNKNKKNLPILCVKEFLGAYGKKIK